MIVRTLQAVAGIALLTFAVGWSSVRPSHDRAWNAAQELMPSAQRDGDIVTIRNVRNFRWLDDGQAVPAWETRHYDLSRVESVWYVLTPFSRGWRGPAHAFVSFGFDDGRYLAISVEARREAGEEYSLLRGMMKRFEVMYVIGDERDLIHLRAARGDDVYVYPIRADRDQVRVMFENMLNRANTLNDSPEFYSTISNNCTSNLLVHVNVVARTRIPYGFRILLPGYSDQLAHRRGLIATDLPLDEARATFAVSERSLRFAEEADYSRLIRASVSD
jgi:hypothetical protein